MTSERYCTYCGSAQGDRLSCCSENHWLTLDEYREYHNEDPCDYEDANPTHAGPDYRTYEQWVADEAWNIRRKRLNGE